MRAGLSELRAHCTEGGEKGRAGECAQEDDLGKSSLGGKARGGLEASKPPGDALGKDYIFPCSHACPSAFVKQFPQKRWSATK